MVKKPGKDLKDVGCLLVGKRGGMMARLSLWQRSGSICIRYFFSYCFPYPCGMVNLFSLLFSKLKLIMSKGGKKAYVNI